jgi:hypothetical protein
MSGIMMALVAGMALGSDAIGRKSMDVEQRLCIEGDWEGTWKESVPSRIRIIRVRPGNMDVIMGPNEFVTFPIMWGDEGMGRCQMTKSSAVVFNCIYKRETGRLIICLLRTEIGMPMGFHPIDGQSLLILKPAKPPKK